MSSDSREQYRATQQAATGLAGSRGLLHDNEPGIHVDVVSGESLLASSDKFDSGSGCPSFAKAIDAANVNERPDPREDGTGARSAHGDIHPGRVFPDGQEVCGGLCYCTNFAALRFIHRDNMKAGGLCGQPGLGEIRP